MTVGGYLHQGIVGEMDIEGCEASDDGIGCVVLLVAWRPGNVGRRSRLRIRRARAFRIVEGRVVGTAVGRCGVGMRLVPAPPTWLV